MRAPGVVYDEPCVEGVLHLVDGLEPGLSPLDAEKKRKACEDCEQVAGGWVKIADKVMKAAVATKAGRQAEKAVDRFANKVNEAIAKAYDKVSGAIRSSRTEKSLGANPFKDKKADEVVDMLKNKGYIPKGSNPAAGQGTYVNPKTGRGYHIDANHPQPKGSHVGVHRPRDARDTFGPRDYPMGGP